MPERKSITKQLALGDEPLDNRRDLEHITDEKPICARQCIKLLPLIAAAKPTLAPKIVSALRDANVARYPDSMRPLVQKDIRDSLLAIER